MQNCCVCWQSKHIDFVRKYNVYMQNHTVYPLAVPMPAAYGRPATVQTSTFRLIMAVVTTSYIRALLLKKNASFPLSASLATYLFINIICGNPQLPLKTALAFLLVAWRNYPLMGILPEMSAVTFHGPNVMNTSRRLYRKSPNVSVHVWFPGFLPDNPLSNEP